MRISRKKRRPEPSKITQFAVNERIRVPKVMVIDNTGANLGVLNVSQAIQKAKENELDLVLINPKLVPPVAKILNFGQFKYQKEKEERQKKAQSHVTEIKGLRITPHIAEHDMQVRVKKACVFLGRGDKVQAEILMRGRDKAHPDIIKEVLKKFIELVKKEVNIRVEQEIQRQGAKFIVLIAKQ